jgi:hypothetical protein
MGITLAKIANNEAKTSFQYEGETINLTYYPGHVTENIVADLQNFSSLNNSNVVSSFKSFNTSLASLIASWDVYEDEAQTAMFPIDASRFSELPIAFRMAVVGAIMSDVRPEAIATSPTAS